MALYKTLFYFLTSLAPLQGTGRFDAYYSLVSKSEFAMFISSLKIVIAGETFENLTGYVIMLT